MKTVAEQIGQTPHISPLLRRLRNAGLRTPEEMRRLAVARGCFHYQMPGDDVSSPLAAGSDAVSDAELAIGLLCASQEFSPIYVRCAAQLLSSDRVSHRDLARLAVQERAVALVRHIAVSAVDLDDDRHRDTWLRLLALLPSGREVPVGRLPHRSRFVSETGLVMRDGLLDRRGAQVWLRPRSISR